jgi:hypothetical protein
MWPVVPYVHVKGSEVEIVSAAHLEPDRPQHDRHAASVIAQQYSSATCDALRFHYRKEKFPRV